LKWSISLDAKKSCQLGSPLITRNAFCFSVLDGDRLMYTLHVCPLLFLELTL
jgi:hypothetical protein